MHIDPHSGSEAFGANALLIGRGSEASQLLQELLRQRTLSVVIPALPGTHRQRQSEHAQLIERGT